MNINIYVYNININKIETEYCDICDRKCDGAHNGKKINTEEKQIQQIVNMLLSYNDNIIDKIIKRVNEIKQTKTEKNTN